MPQSYTHWRIARTAQVLYKGNISSLQAYVWGAQGFAPFDFVHPLKKLRDPEMRGMGEQLRAMPKKAVLWQLHLHAKTPVQQSYALGIICYYAAEELFNPYLNSTTVQEIFPESMSEIAWREAAVDTYFCALDLGKTVLPIEGMLPALSLTEFAQIVQLIKNSFCSLLETPVLLSQVADAFALFRKQQHFCNETTSTKRIIAQGVDRWILQGGSTLRSRQLPAFVPKDGFPHSWHYGKQKGDISCGPSVLCLRATQQAAKQMQTMQRNFLT